MIKLYIDIEMHSEQKPNRDISPTNLVGTLEDIINTAFRVRFPEYEIEIRKLKANWPDSKKEFPTFDRKTEE